MSTRYDTLVVKNSTSSEVPREAAGGEVVSWAAGHALAEMGPLEEFVRALADRQFDCSDDISDAATKALCLSERQREAGYLEGGA